MAGTTHFESSLNTVGTLAVTGTSTLTGNVAAGGTLTVTGASTLAAVGCGAVTSTGAVVGTSVGIGNDVVWLKGTGVPTDGVAGTGVAVAGPGSMYTDYTNSNLYINANTKASPTWKLVTRAA